MRKAQGQTSSSSFLLSFLFFFSFFPRIFLCQAFQRALWRGEMGTPWGSQLSPQLVLGVGQRGVRPSGESLLKHSGYTVVHLKLLHKFGKEYCTEIIIHCFNCSYLMFLHPPRACLNPPAFSAT